MLIAKPPMLIFPNAVLLAKEIHIIQRDDLIIVHFNKNYE